MDIEAIRDSMKVKEHQKVLLAFAWITGRELSFLKRFPEFLAADVTERTNREKRGLFLIVGQDGNNKTFVAFHCYISNAKLDTFNWIYNMAIPQLASRDITLGNEVFVTDGEDALFSPFLNATKIEDGPWANSYHYRCSYHIFYQPWRKTISGKVKDAEGKKVVETIRIWIITLLKQVRSYADYVDSVNKLTSFIEVHKSRLSDYVYQSVHQIFFGSMHPNCTTWARFSRCQRMDFNHSTSSITEGENRTFKEHAGGKSSNLAKKSIDESARVAVDHSESRLREIDRYVTCI